MGKNGTDFVYITLPPLYPYKLRDCDDLVLIDNKTWKVWPQTHISGSVRGRNRAEKSKPPKVTFMAYFQQTLQNFNFLAQCSGEIGEE